MARLLWFPFSTGSEFLPRHEGGYLDYFAQFESDGEVCTQRHGVSVKGVPNPDRPSKSQNC
jgi:hypothetical protein